MSVDLELRHLRLVAAIADEGSVTKAAGRLHLTQSALSHQLRELESRVGTPLFLRLKRRMVPTPSGEKLLASARSLLLSAARVAEEIGRLASGREGVLRLATECYTCYHWVPPVLVEYGRMRPGVDVEIVADATRRPLEALEEGRLEVAIVSSPVDDARLLLTPLFSDEMVAVMRPDHPLASRSRIRPEDFANETLVLYTGPEDSTLFQRVLTPAHVAPRQLMKVQLTEAIVEMVKAGIGISCLARWAVEREVASGDLVAVRLSHGGLRRRWFAATLRATGGIGYVQDFVRLLARSGRPFGEGTEGTVRRVRLVG
jgi:LysR family transcriptional regulator for metE and metH